MSSKLRNIRLVVYVDKNLDGSDRYGIATARGRLVAVGLSRKDVMAIVKACNHHAELVEALRECMECLDLKEGFEPYDTATALITKLDAEK